MKLIPICEHADSLIILAMARKMNIKFNQIRKKKIITQAKYEEQQGRCGYCEANLLDKDGNLSSKCVHLDHFHQQCLCDELKFSWNNLILSCNSPNSCGYYKDTPRQKISSSDIFNPHNTSEDPREHFVFIEEKSGEVSIQPVRNSTLFQKAKNTIDALHLDFIDLREKRGSELAKFKPTIDQLVFDVTECLLQGNDITLFQSFFDELLDDIENGAHPSAILSYAKNQLSGLLHV